MCDARMSRHEFHLFLENNRTPHLSSQLLGALAMTCQTVPAQVEQVLYGEQIVVFRHLCNYVATHELVPIEPIISIWEEDLYDPEFYLFFFMLSGVVVVARSGQRLVSWFTGNVSVIKTLKV